MKWNCIEAAEIFLLLWCSLYPASSGTRGVSRSASLANTRASAVHRPFLINNIFSYYANNGEGSYNPFSSNNEGFESPKGSGNCLVFQQGVVWGGFHKGRSSPTVDGTVYQHGLQPGKILVPGTVATGPLADDPADPRYRIYRVRPDITPAIAFSTIALKIQIEEFSLIARYETTTAKTIYDQYLKDWKEWPAGDGAPFWDKDGNGLYDPAVDVPGVPGADQTLWYVANDMDSAAVYNFCGSPSIGIEMQRLIWGYNRPGGMSQSIFMSTLLINKSSAPIDSMFLLNFVDPDIGDSNDDFVGCDTARNLGYGYNGDSTDAVLRVAVPAVGATLLQGPRVPGTPEESATFRYHRRAGFRNLGMTSFTMFTGGNASIYEDPRVGSGGDVEWYRLMNGLVALNGAPFINAVSGQPSQFVYSGDPVAGSGWLDGTLTPQPSDRRFCVTTGSFSLAPGDSQEIVVAVLCGQGADRFSSITVLKSFTDQIRASYDTLFSVPPATGPAVATPPVAPPIFSLLQNFPNPFNASTTITYALPSAGRVTMKVYDLLGREVRVLISGDDESAGQNVVGWDGRNNAGHAVASGVYVYRMQAEGMGSALVKKMVVLR